MERGAMENLAEAPYSMQYVMPHLQHKRRLDSAFGLAEAGVGHERDAAYNRFNQPRQRATRPRGLAPLDTLGAR
jgi:hypothetical protein